MTTVNGELTAMSNEVHDDWTASGRYLLSKTIALLAFEDLIRLDRQNGYHNRYQFNLGSEVTWSFEGRLGRMGTWTVDPNSITRDSDATAEDLLFEQIITDLAPTLDWDGATTAEMVVEAIATHRAEHHVRGRAMKAKEWAQLDFTELEAQQNGHPSMFLNKGRIGFTNDDWVAYAPESANEFPIVWLAAHSSIATSVTMNGRQWRDLVETQMAGDIAEALERELKRHAANFGRPVSEYVYVPVHPYQWNHIIQIYYASFIVNGSLIYIFEGQDCYRALQSVRTLTNISRANAYDVKLALHIRNTLVWRGLSKQHCLAAPAISAWLKDIQAADHYLSSGTRLHLLGEIAGVSVDNPMFDRILDLPYRYQGLVGAILREPITDFLSDGECARSVASLLKVDVEGKSLVQELVANSGLSATSWLQQLFHVLLPGLLHYMYAYGVGFCPHGENSIIVFDASDVPVGLALKDFSGDLMVLSDSSGHYVAPPADARAGVRELPAEKLAHSVHTAVVLGTALNLSYVSERTLQVEESVIWSLIKSELVAYEDQFPDLAQKGRQFGLMSQTFERLCLNKEQLFGQKHHERVDMDDEFVLGYGRVENPIALTQEIGSRS